MLGWMDGAEDGAGRHRTRSDSKSAFHGHQRLHFLSHARLSLSMGPM